ncbi:MAG: hypothetical protein HYR85_14525 [Planctomycetes bacterium]|nr:hypothetical protein [Planctomycetota bacterium]MBI3845561.1 hypothetical protein [Planctomycetota bacterium]
MFKLLKRLVVLAIVVAIGAWFFGGCVLAKSASAAGTASLGVPVSVSRVGINPFAGRLSLNGLTVGNPPGFEPRDLLRVDSFSVEASLSSALGSGPIEIPELTIDGLTVGLEVRGTSTNVGTLADLLAAKRGTSSSKSEREILLRKVRIEGIVLKPLRQIPGLSEAGIPLPPIHLEDFSVGGKPTTLSDVVAVLVGAIASEISRSATSLPGDVLNGLGVAGESAAKSIAGELEKGLGSIFDKLRGEKK